MKKRKREKVDWTKREKQMEWERIKDLQKEEAMINLLCVHFSSDEYRCEYCADFNPDICEGKGYTTFDERYDCMEEKYENGEEMIMTNVGV